MELKTKSWLWKLSWPFAHRNWTLVGPNVLYCPKGRKTSKRLLAHEEIHARQMKDNGVFVYYFVYLLLFPLFYNPWRKKWEMEAYMKGSGLTEEDARAKLRTAMYGWIR